MANRKTPLNVGGVGVANDCDIINSTLSRKLKLQDIFASEESRLSADLKWSLFRAASESYKFDSLLKPFPKNYLRRDDEKDIVKLMSIADKLECMPETKDMLNALNDELIDLLHWVLFDGIIPTLQFVPKTDYSQIMKCVPGRKSTWPLPTHIFKVDHSSAVFTTKFNKLAETYGTRFGFHGSRLENFVSILNYGLQVSMMKVGAFGPGVYLSSELSVSLQYSPHGLSWSGSSLGGLLSIVALCDMISHPAVRCRDDNIKSSGGVLIGGELGPVPNKYFIVENSELVRIRYLLVYAKNARSSFEFNASSLLPSNRRTVILVISFTLAFLFFGLRCLS